MSSKLPVVRCSSLPMAFACPGSIRAGDIEISPVSEPADQGSAGHEVQRQIVERDANGIHGIDLEAVARRFDADPEELRIQAFVGVRVWQKVRQWFPDAQAEVELSAEVAGVELVGHLDVLSVALRQRNLNIGDWKWGRVDGNYSEQLNGYMDLGLRTYDVDTARSILGWMREGDVESYSMDHAQRIEWEERLRRKVVDWDGVFHPGPHCANCRRSHDCPAVTAMVRRDVAMIGSPEMAARIEAGLADLPDAEVVELRRKAGVLKKVIDSLDEAIKLRVSRAGSLPDGNGRELRFVEQAKRRLDPERAWPVLEEFLTEAEIAGCITIHPSAVDKAVGAKTEKGKGKRIKEIGEALEAAGALSHEVTRRLQDMKLKGDPT